jgi:alcohol dehydrogenase
MLPHVIRFNGVEHNGWYSELLQCTSGQNGAPRPATGAKGLAEFIGDLLARSGLAARLSECGVTREALEPMAAEAEKQWTGTFNPRPVQRPELLELYEAAF